MLRTSLEVEDIDTILRAETGGHIPVDHCKPAENILEAYNNLFLAYYNLSPNICMNDISIALSQGELLIRLAEEYNSTNTIRPYIGHSLSQYRRDLYTSIARDPPRWLGISIPLQSAAIFTESIIHIVGCCPSWPWSTKRTCLSKDIRTFILHKAKKLNDKRLKVNQDLFLNTLTIQNKPVDVTEGTSNFESWMIAQIFRDWFCREGVYCTSFPFSSH